MDSISRLFRKCCAFALPRTDGTLLPLWALFACIAVLSGCTREQQFFEPVTGGIVVSPTGGGAEKVRLQVITPKIIRVSTFPTQDMTLPESLSVLPVTGDTKFEVTQDKKAVTLTTSELTVLVSIAKGNVIFKDRSGKLLVCELDKGRTFTPVQVDGKAQVDGRQHYAIRQQFASPSDEAFYGLGQHQNGVMNYKGKDVEIAQHNIDDGYPFILSSRNYGILWDNTSITRFGDPREWQPLSKSLELYDADGKAGGLTARYSVNGVEKLTRTESDVNYQYIPQRATFPAELAKAPEQRVVWEGKIEANSSGTHKFTLFASDYNKLFVDGELVIDAWRQNWNPWYRDFTLEMVAGKPRAIRIEWNRTSGYLALQHRDPLPDFQQGQLSLYSELARGIDYYFMKGANADDVVAGYRKLTGKATLLPKWVYGFWQSRERYKTQAELVDTVKEYRKRRIPLDNIVMDWMYWKEDSWGSHEFDPERFPDPQGMVNQVHDLHANIMISVWPKFYPTTANYKELDAKAYIYPRNVEVGEKDWVGPGYLSSFYDPYSDEARAIYWRQIDEKLNKLGMDAWWLDSVEPDMHSNLDITERKRRMGPTAMGPGSLYFNSYPLMNARAVYEGARTANPDKRVFIFTRSAFAGLQRYASAVWSGDVAARWSDLKDQISAGVNFSMSGIPNWTTDSGGFSVEPRYEKPNAKDLAEWRELNTRWFQFATFNPLFRSHGQFPYREIYHLAPEGSEVYRTLVDHDKLRYRLLPYIYSIAGDTYHRDYTMMRGLFMDFPADNAVRDINDEFLLGPAFLIAPVSEYAARSREVYLPAGSSWYNFHTGERVPGGKRVLADAGLDRIPVFVKAGSIVPSGVELQYVSEKPDAPITLNVYTGANGAFSLYEDSGKDYGYEKGAFSRIELKFDDATGKLTIGARAGEYPGMQRERTFNVRFIRPGMAGADFEAKPDRVVSYTGASVGVESGSQTVTTAPPPDRFARLNRPP